MSIKVEKIGKKLIVETDYSGADVDHSMIHGDRELIGAMKSFGIDNLEGLKRTGVLYSLRESFDEQFKKKTGRSSGYLHPW